MRVFRDFQIFVVLKLNIQAAIKYAASAGSPEGFGRRKGGQALDLGPGPGWAHGLSSSKSFRGGCARSRLDQGLRVVLVLYFFECLAASAAKYCERKAGIAQNLLASRLALASGGKTSDLRTSKKLKPRFW